MYIQISSEINDTEHNRYHLDKIELEDEIIFIFLAQIRKDPNSYKQAILTDEKDRLLEAINDELNSMAENDVWYIVDRPIHLSTKEKPNIVDSRWVCKKKIDDKK